MLEQIVERCIVCISYICSFALYNNKRHFSGLEYFSPWNQSAVGRNYRNWNFFSNLHKRFTINIIIPSPLWMSEKIALEIKQLFFFFFFFFHPPHLPGTKNILQPDKPLVFVMLCDLLCHDTYLLVSSICSLMKIVKDFCYFSPEIHAVSWVGLVVYE